MNKYNASAVNHKALGPWGGQSGYRWDDGVYSGVRQVVISTSSVGIHLIQFEYDKNGYSVWSEIHGNRGIRTDQIKLDYPTQFLVSISGYYGSISDRGQTIVRSLTLETNKKKYGPFGIERGTPFSVPVSGEMLVGFHGWCSNYLNSIGVYVKTHQQATYQEPPQMIPPNPVGGDNRILSLGPWGGEGGTVFDDGIYTGVREVHITRSGGLVSIRVCYDKNGKMVWGNKHGGSGGLNLDKIVFDYPYEVLTQITGYYGSKIMRGPIIIKSITFHTSKRTYGPFGDPQGFPFSSGSTGSYAIVGFLGRNGYFVHSLGVHVRDSKPVLPPSYPYADPYSDPYDDMTKPSEEVWGMPTLPASPHETGPWGGLGGTPWDDGIYTGIKKIILTRGDVICSLQIQYDHHGHSVWSAPHGIANKACTYHIKFDYPNEELTRISGYYDILVGNVQRMVIRSLTFHTNRTRYGPYGKAIGTYFSSPNKEGRVVGFHGRSGAFLDAIGVHMQYDELSHHQYPLKQYYYK